MSKHIKKKHQKGDVLLYRHPVFNWLWFGKNNDDNIVCYTSRVIPAYSNKQTITDTPQAEMKGLLEHTGIRVIISSHKGEKYRITFEAGYEESSTYTSGRTLKSKKRKKVSKQERPDYQTADEFLSAMTSFNTDEEPDPLRDDGYELFDFPLPTFYFRQTVKIDYSKIKQLESGIWTIITKQGYLGGFETPIDAYKEYLRLRGTK